MGIDSERAGACACTRSLPCVSGWAMARFNMSGMSLWQARRFVWGESDGHWACLSTWDT